MLSRCISCVLIIAIESGNAFGKNADATSEFNALQAITSGDAFDHGMQEYRAANWKEAARWMTITEEQSPGKTEALVIRGSSLLHLGEFAEASQALRSYIAQHATSSEALYMLGYSLNKQNKPSESLETYTRAAKYAPPGAGDFEIVGLDYVLLNDYPDAIKWLEHAVELDPVNVETLYALGRCYYTQSRYDDAEKKFRAVLQLQTDNRKAWQNLALVLDAMNRPDEADRAFKRSIELSASDPKVNEWPYLDYGGFLLTHDRPFEAVPILQRAVAIAPACAACHEKLGRSLSSLGRSSDAEHELERAVALDPQNPKMHFELSRVYRLDGNMQKARDEAALSAKLYGTQASPETK